MRERIRKGTVENHDSVGSKKGNSWLVHDLRQAGLDGELAPDSHSYSKGIKGIYSALYNYTKWGFDVVGFGNWMIWRLRFDYCDIEMGFGEIFFSNFASLRINEMKILVSYINLVDMVAILIVFKHFQFSIFIHRKAVILSWFTMTQGHLIGNSGDTRNGEGTRKRLKITFRQF